MRYLSIPRFAVVLAIQMFLGIASPAAVKAQGRENEKEVPPVNGNSNRRWKVIKVTPDITSLAVFTAPGARIQVVPTSTGKALKPEDADEEGGVIFEGLTPGEYRVTAQLDGYKSIDNKNELAEKLITIRRSKPEKVTLKLKQIAYEVTINFNISAGEVKYQVKNAKDSERRMKALENGRAVLSDLLPGTYDLEVSPENRGYKPLHKTIEISADKTINLELERIETTREFSWGIRQDWTAPDSWSVNSGKLVINDSGLAIPRETGFHNYVDFKLTSDVIMVNGMAASFALRLKDAQDYYLIQLTGEKADEPYWLRAYIVERGDAHPLGTAQSVKGFAPILKQNQRITLEVTVKDNKIEVALQDPETGEFSPVGIFTDENRTFRRGAVGIVAGKGEQSEIGRFIVCPLDKCLDN